MDGLRSVSILLYYLISRDQNCPANLTAYFEDVEAEVVNFLHTSPMGIVAHCTSILLFDRLLRVQKLLVQPVVGKLLDVALFIVIALLIYLVRSKVLRTANNRFLSTNDSHDISNKYDCLIIKQHTLVFVENEDRAKERIGLTQSIAQIKV
uniref:Uncharacterized protein n=1 Tax=Glossina pallidipes TaxID=7398 RepID=A0A1A9ZTN6_GLOPL